MSNVIVIQPDDVDAIAEVDKIESSHAPIQTLLNIEYELQAKTVAPAKSDSISADCHHDYHAYHNSGRRPLSVIELVVIHATQGGTARSNAVYFQSSKSGGSTQLVVDDNFCYRCLSDNEIPWGAPGANYSGFHIEQCGYTAWLTTMWSKTHRRTLMRAAYKAAYHCRKYGIEPRFLPAASLKAGKLNGITTHAECTKAFGGDHTDPGTGWPRLLFMTMVKTYYMQIGGKVRPVA